MNNFHYTVSDIVGALSLRKPQEKSLRILDEILQKIDLTSKLELPSCEKIINESYPVFTKSERDFLSMTFALATGVGKTRLMGAFIAYLYTNHNIKNFFVVAPGTTIFEKLKQDLGNENNPKYVFKGLSCFSSSPQIITDDDYRTKQISLFESDINIFVYNIDKFNQEDSKMRSMNEFLGDSFFGELSSLDDLVLIMDESHNYRAAKGSKALNDLQPILGLELTATPFVAKSNKQILFKNVVFEYPLSQAIADGYTRTPFAVTRTDVDFFNFGDVEQDKLMLSDGILCHERAKVNLEQYANVENKRKVKPFMLVVCKDTTHATWVEEYIKSDKFKDGAYKNKTIIVHSNQSKAESEDNLRLLLDVEKAENPIEVVIHVNKLKEGWDVNNLYTIVPLRSATSVILREQMVGRGLRLPYGERTGNKAVDSVMITAHDKFKEILEAAQKGDSIFKAGNVIKAEELEKEKTVCTQLVLPIDKTELLMKVYGQTNLTVSKENDQLIVEANQLITKKINESKLLEDTDENIETIKNAVIHSIKTNEDLGRIFKENEFPISQWLEDETKLKVKQAIAKYIPIPKIHIVDSGVGEFYFDDFDLDLENLQYQPIKNELIAQDLTNVRNVERLNSNNIDFDADQPPKVLLGEIRRKSEIDYDRDSELLHKLITQFINEMVAKFNENGMKNIVMMFKKDISNEIFKQMMNHFCQTVGLFTEEVISPEKSNIKSVYTYENKLEIFEPYNSKEHGNIKSVAFHGAKKSVFDPVKFDSVPELELAKNLERESAVVNWLRPSLNEFDIKYNREKKYQPDFVVETDDQIYLLEVKGEDKINDPDVLSKTERAVSYCNIVNVWSLVNGYKPWTYVFIPSKEIMLNSSFDYLVSRFNVKSD